MAAVDSRVIQSQQRIFKVVGFGGSGNESGRDNVLRCGDGRANFVALAVVLGASKSESMLQLRDVWSLSLYGGSGSQRLSRQ